MQGADVDFLLAEVRDWDVLYSVSSGMDTNSEECLQRWNPFNGDVTAPASWFRLGITDGIHCACNIKKNAQCIFVFEYGVEYSALLQQLAKEMGIPWLCLESLAPDSICIAGIQNGKRTRLTAITFPRPPPLLFPLDCPPGCCEMHALLHFTVHSGEPYLQPLLHSRVCTSGHMSIHSLLARDPFGDWEPLVQKWLDGGFLKIFSSQKRRQRK